MEEQPEADAKESLLSLESLKAERATLLNDLVALEQKKGSRGAEENDKAIQALIEKIEALDQGLKRENDRIHAQQRHKREELEEHYRNKFMTLEKITASTSRSMIVVELLILMVVLLGAGVWSGGVSIESIKAYFEPGYPALKGVVVFSGGVSAALLSLLFFYGFQYFLNKSKKTRLEQELYLALQEAYSEGLSHSTVGHARSQGSKASYSAAGHRSPKGLKTRSVAIQKQNQALKARKAMQSYIDSPSLRLRERLDGHLEKLESKSLYMLISALTIAVMGVVILFQWGDPTEIKDFATIPLSKLLLVYAPKAGMVLAIEYVAFFFLRMYRETLNEIKYYHNELTNLDSKEHGLAIARQLENKEVVLQEVVGVLMQTERNHVLNAGQTTVEIEKIRAENSLFENMSGAFSGRRSGGAGAQAGRSHDKKKAQGEG
ncbi:hypothetical protein [Magnetococcus sp. PR-3]|uniref:hypothetical protein n=1 Tax=Magnetococcus sp. PR-3 TaxID=3120355 RepID=UPI002FCDF0B1